MLSGRVDKCSARPVSGKPTTLYLGIDRLRDSGCHKVILIRPDEQKKRQADRRDAAALSERLWANRDRWLRGKPVRGLRQVELTDPADRETRLRTEAGVARARLIHKVVCDRPPALFGSRLTSARRMLAGWPTSPRS